MSNMRQITLFYLDVICMVLCGADADADADADAYLDMLHQVPRVREAKRAVAALKVWGRCLVRANLQMASVNNIL